MFVCGRPIALINTDALVGFDCWLGQVFQSQGHSKETYMTSDLRDDAPTYFFPFYRKFECNTNISLRIYMMVHQSLTLR